MKTRKLNTRILLCLGIVMVLLSIPLQAQQGNTSFPYTEPEIQGLSSEALQELTGTVKKYFEEGMIIGAELVVIKNRHTVLHEVFGWRDRENKIPMERNSIFNIRSMTKPITGAGIHLLIDQRKLKLESRAAEFLPGFQNEKSRAITIWQILTHRSGLPLTILKAIDEFPDLITMGNAIGERGPQFEPGSKFWYSDAGTDVLGAITEVISDTTLEAFRQKSILDPLGMKDTFTINKGEDPRKERVVSLYAGGVNAWRRFWKASDDPFYPFAWGSQTLYSTPMDYARFLAMWMDDGMISNKRLLSQNAIKEILTPVSIMSTLGSDTPMPTEFRRLRTYYGQMAILYADPSSADSTKPVILSHSGSDGTHAWAWPDHDLMILYFTQSRGQATGIRLEKEIDRLLIHPGEKVEVTEIREEFRPYLGNYTSDFGQRQNTTMKVLVENGNLAVDIPGQMVFELNEPDAEGFRTFKMTPLVSIGFNEENGKVTAMLLNQTSLLPKKAEPDSILDDVPFEYRPYLGAYTLPIANREFTIFYRDSLLKVDVPNEGQPVLNPPDEKGVWTIRDDDEITLTFDKDSTGRVTVMNLTQLLVIPRGLPVSNLIEEILLSDGLEAAVTKFRVFNKSIPEGYFFNERGFNNLGYKLLGEEKFDEAVAVFKLNVEAYPESFNVYDSLGEAYMKKGDKELAVQNYNKSLELNPDNENGKQMLEKLQQE